MKRRLVAAAEGGAVVRAAGRIVRIIRIVVACSAGGAAKGGFVAILAVVDLALILETSETALDVVELGGRHHVVGTSREDSGNLFLRVNDAVRSLGMIREDLCQCARLVLLKRIELLKELDEGLRIVS